MKAKRVKTISVGKKGVAAFVLLFVLLFLPSSSYSETFEVGPGKRFESIGDVPWESLSAGDEVLIYWRAQWHAPGDRRRVSRPGQIGRWKSDRSCRISLGSS